MLFGQDHPGAMLGGDAAGANAAGAGAENEKIAVVSGQGFSA
jgi:hypothetical protein